MHLLRLIFGQPLPGAVGVAWRSVGGHSFGNTIYSYSWICETVTPFEKDF